VTADRQVVLPGKRYRITPTGGVSVTETSAPQSRELHRLPEGTIIVCAQVEAPGGGAVRVRLGSPTGWIDAAALEPAPDAVLPMLDYETFLARHEQVRAGDHYGLEFPISLEGLRAAGPEFLTRAFRAAGSIAPDNSVTAIVSLDPLDVRGASENGLLTVAYARHEPGLDTDLFVKFPPTEPSFKFGLQRLYNGETEMMRLSRERTLPVTTGKYYFGDHSIETTNFILITDRIAFGVDPVEPAYRKGYDHLVPEVEEHYDVLIRSLAQLAAAHKRGALGLDIEDVFPFALALRDFDPIPDPEPNLDALIDFIGRVAPQLFSPELTTPEFLARWREDVLFGLKHKDTVHAYLLADVDYTGLCHINLNVDNAWYWRDETGKLHAGLLDWGGAGQTSIAQALSGMLMMPEPERHMPLVQRMIDIFLAEYTANGGPPIDRDELFFQYKASVYSTAICMFVTLLAPSLAYFPEGYFDTIEERKDARLLETGFYSAVVWINNMLSEWLDELTPGDACRTIVARAQAKATAPVG
jgi:hypothetical protein